MSTTERATPENFDEERYLLANPDVADFVYGGGVARDHFDAHGHAEERPQLTIAALGTDLSRAHRKYLRFEGVLDASAGDGGDFRSLEQPGALPLYYGRHPNGEFSLDAYEGESANAAHEPFVRMLRDNPDMLFLDVGCGRRNYTYDNCLYIEVYRSASADLVIEPACTYPIRSGSIDAISCFAVLEHVPEPWKVARDFHRMLKPGGQVFIDWPFLQPLHGYPSHYYNATHLGLERMFAAGFDLVSNETLDNQTPDASLRWMLEGIADNITDPAVRDAFGKATVDDLIATPLSGALWSQIRVALNEDGRRRFAAGSTLVARKR